MVLPLVSNVDNGTLCTSTEATENLVECHLGRLAIRYGFELVGIDFVPKSEELRPSQ